MYSQTLLWMYKRKMEQQKEKRKIKRKSIWVRGWLCRRKQFGHWSTLLQELIKEDKSSFHNFLRMDENLFSEVLHRINHRIEKRHTSFRAPLEPGLRLALTLRFLATGDSYKSLSYGFRVAPNTICSVVAETCEAIIAEYMDEVIVFPETPEDWKKVAEGFKKRWNFEHTLGAIDGRHIRMKNPPKSGSYYFNYKGFFSIVLLAIVDSDYKFIYCDVGANGASSDAGIFNNTDLKLALDENAVALPPPVPLTGGGRPIPYFFVGDEAFALKDWLQKPYPHRGLTKEQRIFNYRLSRARRIVENSFGILANR